MILFASDFGLAGPYVGQVHAVLARHAPGVPVIDLMHDLPAFRPAGAGVLIRALMRTTAFSKRPAAGRGPDVVLAVVDPGVGTTRRPIILETDGMFLVGPDNGLFAGMIENGSIRAWRIDWRPERLSDSFHGRDLFAPVAAKLAQNQPVDRSPVEPADLVRPKGAGTLAEVIYCDRFGNAMTGIEAEGLGDDVALEAGGQKLPRVRTFGEVRVGSGFWYANSLGLAEIAVNQGSAAERFGLAVGTPVQLSG